MKRVHYCPRCAEPVFWRNKYCSDRCKATVANLMLQQRIRGWTLVAIGKKYKVSGTTVHHMLGWFQRRLRAMLKKTDAGDSVPVVQKR